MALMIKEVADSLHFKVIGAEINSKESQAKKVIISLGAPAVKRFGLMMLSARAARLPYTSDALHASLLGSWISALMCRRPMMAHVNHLFHVIDAKQLSPSDSKMRPLQRNAAEEPLILACLGPLAASNVSVPFSTVLYASDASTLKGGLVSADISEELSRSLRRISTKKAKNPGGFRAEQLHRTHDQDFEEVLMMPYAMSSSKRSRAGLLV